MTDVGPKKSATRSSACLALATLAIVAVHPPEAYGSGRMLLVLMATFALTFLLIESRIPASFLAAGALAASLLLAHSLWISVDPYRSVEFLGLMWAYYCLYGAFRYSPVDLRKPACLVLVLTAGGVALYGMYQFFWGFDSLYALVSESQASEAVRSPLLERIASERVFATFALPGTLWGFLILTLPLHAPLWKDASTLRRLFIAANVILIVAVSALTQSYGFVLGLLVLLGGWTLTRSRGVSLPRAAMASVLVAPLAGAAVLALYLTRVSGHNPVWLRIQNWLSAWEMFATHPLGSGLNAYATLYLQHQLPGANETQFAHDTALQLMAELGVFGFVLIVVAALYLLTRAPLLTGITGVRRCLLLGLMVWGVHNLVDINFYFASVGAIGAALMGLFMWSPVEARIEIRPYPSRYLLAAAGVLAALALATSGIVYVSGEFLNRAQGELEFLKVPEASETLRIAARINPFDPSILSEAGQAELELYHATHDEARIEAAEAYFRRAVWISPERASPHIGLALTLASQDRTREAVDQLEIAQTLYPAGTQATNIRRMIEKRPIDPQTSEPSME